MLGLASIVEGKGEVQALPIVLRRLQSEMQALHVFNILEPILKPKDKLLRPAELEDAVDLASRKIARKRAILVVLDSDDALPCDLGPRLLRRAEEAASEIPVRVVLAHREWESWYMMAIESLSGKRSPPVHYTVDNANRALRFAPTSRRGHGMGCVSRKHHVLRRIWLRRYL